MAIVGIGMDLVEIARIRNILDRFGEKFLLRILSHAELNAMPLRITRRDAYVAARFAAKEAAAKALGTGFSGGIQPSNMEVVSMPSGAPRLLLSGAALDAARRLDVCACHLTLTHSVTHAAAVAILESAVQPSCSLPD